MKPSWPLWNPRVEEPAVLEAPTEKSPMSELERTGDLLVRVLGAVNKKATAGSNAQWGSNMWNGQPKNPLQIVCEDCVRGLSEDDRATLGNILERILR
jgi:hypothetical protein